MKITLIIVMLLTTVSCATLGDNLLYIKHELAYEECRIAVYTTGDNPKIEIKRTLDYGERRSFVGRLPLIGKAYCPISEIEKEVLFTSADGDELVFR